MNAESIRKTLKISYFITAYAIMKKRTTDKYLNKVSYLAKSWSLSHSV